MTDWDAIVARHSEIVLRAAYRLLGSLDEAEDVAQDVFSQVVAMERQQSITNWAGLLRHLATMRAIDRLRRRRPVEVLPDVPAPIDCDPVEAAVLSELAQWLRQAIGQLPPHQAEVFSLTYFEQVPRDEIASLLDISVEAVSTALYKARQRLRCLLPDAVEEPSHE
jgi:RNA polymerase sigma-70 factor, ECF subfamily